jgi:hypothetical protein
MSGLAALLAGHTPPDLYQWHSAAHVPDVEHAVEQAGWQFVHLDAWTIEDKQSFLKAAAATFDAATFDAATFGVADDPADPAVDLAVDLGENFDAFSDLLAEVDPGDRNGTIWLWDGWSPFARHDEQAFHVALSVLGGRANAERGAAFAVLLRGEGPHLDLPELPVKH